MCGIVGYVGEKQAQDVVIEGLRRLEYRGYDSAGIALVSGGPDRLGEEGRQAGQPREGALGVTAAEPPPRGSGTPAGPPTVPPTTPTPIRTSATRAGSRWCTTASSRTSPSCAPRSRPPATSCGRRPTPRSRPTCSRPRWPRAARSPTRCSGSARGSRAPSRWSPSTRRTRRASWRHAGAPRSWWGSARARTSSAPTSRRSSSTPARRWSSARTRSSRSPATVSR